MRPSWLGDAMNKSGESHEYDKLDHQQILDAF